jgi:uncharacterized protein (DUF362 family)/NAD-dependent dihydropyrimidine dehydrogenase PreA subunit
VARVIVRPADYPVSEGLTDEILDALAPDLRGKKVLLKPNCLMASPPDDAVTTHPSLVRSLVSSFERRGASVQVGDNPGARGYGAGEHCFRVTGLLDAAGGHFVDFGQDTVRVPLKSSFADEVIVSRHLLEADYVVSVPKLKTHCLTVMTGAVKNMYGMLAGGEKTRLHYEARRGDDFSEALIDVFALRPPDLSVMDAVTVMEGDGPSHGSPRRAGLLIASDNAVALDSFAAGLMGIRADRVGHLAVAARRGLGSLERGEIEVDGPSAPFVGFRLPSTFRIGIMNFVSNSLVFNVLHRSRLRVDPEECTACGECLEVCPSGAMVEKDGQPVVDSRACHQCFCCYELCPTGAVKVRGALGALLRGRTEY